MFSHESVVYREHARLLKATKLADLLAGYRITAEEAKRISAHWWHLVAVEARVKPPSAETIELVIRLMSAREEMEKGAPA